MAPRSFCLLLKVTLSRMEMSTRKICLFLSFVVLGIYYPAIFAEVNSLDDDLMFDQVASLKFSDIPSFFTTSSLYYRPLLMASYVVDHHAFGQVAPIVHFENILIHLFNVLLVYLLASKLFSDHHGRTAAFVTALLFAVNPLATESVAWISGRTDLLCTLFILLSFLAIHYAQMSQRAWWAIVSAALLFLGCLVKELAFFSIPAIIMFTIYLDASRDFDFSWGGIRWSKLWAYLLPFVIVGISYVGIRIALAPKSFVGEAMKIVPSASPVGEGSLVVDVLKYYGFYFKKLIFPYPLNFAIVHVSDAYAWLGAAGLAVIVWVISQRRLYSLALAMIVCILISAIYVALRKVAWTPAAERYLYLATAFSALGIVDAVRHHFSFVTGKKTFQLSVFVLIVLISSTTVKRLMVWQSNQALYQDTVKKTPDFAPLRNQLAIALVNENRYEEALAQIEVGKGKNQQGDRMLLYINQALIEVEKKNFDRADEILRSTIGSAGSVHPEVLKALINVTERKLVYGKNADSNKSRKELMELHELHYTRSRDPLHLYRTGQLALSLGNKDKAFTCFSTVGAEASKDAYYKDAAKKLALKVSLELKNHLDGDL